MSAIADMRWGPIVPRTEASGIWIPAFAGMTPRLWQAFRTTQSPESGARPSRGARPHVAFDLRAAVLARLGQVVHGLQIHPELGAGAEEAREPQRRVRRHRALALDDRADAGRGHAQGHRERVHGHAERRKKFLAERLAGMRGHAVGGGDALSGSRRFRHWPAPPVHVRTSLLSC